MRRFRSITSSMDANLYVGPFGEIVVDDSNQLRLQNNSTPGGTLLTLSTGNITFSGSTISTISGAETNVTIESTGLFINSDLRPTTNMERSLGSENQMFAEAWIGNIRIQSVDGNSPKIFTPESNLTIAVSRHYFSIQDVSVGENPNIGTGAIFILDDVDHSNGPTLQTWYGNVATPWDPPGQHSLDVLASPTSPTNYVELASSDWSNYVGVDNAGAFIMTDWNNNPDNRWDFDLGGNLTLSPAGMIKSRDDDSYLELYQGNVHVTTIDNDNVTIHTTTFDRSGNISFGGSLLPSSNVTYSLGSAEFQWQDLWVSNSTIYIGGVPIGIDAQGDLTVNGNVVTGGSSPIQPYLELTNVPFITLPVVLGSPVTITAAPQGVNAQYSVVIGDGGVIDSVTVTQAGSGYVVGQRYLIPSYLVGGINDDSGIIVVAATVGELGELLTITIEGFVGLTHSNTPGTYTNTTSDYLPSVFDTIDVGVTLTRDNVRGLFNSNLEVQYNNTTYASPLGTEWNSDGWGDLTDLRSRSYDNMRAALNGAIGNNIIGAELVMHDIANDKYYKFSFTAWGENNGAYSYTRNLITDPNFFKKTDGGSEVDIFIPDDGAGAGIGITRSNNNGIYNPYREGSWNSSVSPGGTLWNTDGLDDLSNLLTRNYQNFFAAFGNGGLGLKVPGSKTVMYIPDNGKYYAIEWQDWTQGGGGGFSYTRREIDQTKINTGVRFPDGSVLNSAEGVGRVKATASNGRRIEEVTGNKTVSVTARLTTNLTTVASRAGVGTQQVWIDTTTTTIDDIIQNPQNYGNAYDFQFSLDDITWYNYDGGYATSGDEIGFYILSGSLTYNQGDTVYFRYSTGGESVVWWDKADLPGGASNFRGAIIDYHAYTGESTIIGTIHIVDDDAEENITHTEVASGSTDGENDDLWVVQNEGTISYRRIDGESKTLKTQWIAKIFYGTELYD